jgi:hypothetical protein
MASSGLGDADDLPSWSWSDVLVYGDSLNGNGHPSHDGIKTMLVTCYLLGEYAMYYFVHECTVRTFILGPAFCNNDLQLVVCG